MEDQTHNIRTVKNGCFCMAGVMSLELLISRQSHGGFVMSPFLYLTIIGIPQIEPSRLLVSPPAAW